MQKNVQEYSYIIKKIVMLVLHESLRPLELGFPVAGQCNRTRKEAFRMKRNAMAALQQWKESKHRKPLVLRGARQVGKTWLMKEFGRTAYEDFVYFNFDEDEALKSIFETNKDPHRIVELLSLIVNRKIEPEKTLLILDEIQECPSALNALKYFKEKASDHRGGQPARDAPCPAEVVSCRHGQSARSRAFDLR